VGDAGGTYRANASGPPGGYFETAADLVLAGVDVDQRRCQSQVTVRFGVENRGAKEVPAGAQVDVYRSSIAAGNLVASKFTTRTLVPGAAERFAVTIGALLGNEKIIIVVNGAGTIPECSSKGNNKVELTGAGCL